MKLSDWLNERDENGRRLRRRIRFAQAIGVQPSMVTEYCRGGAWPGRAVIARIIAETGGVVTADDLLAEGGPSKDAAA